MNKTLILVLMLGIMVTLAGCNRMTEKQLTGIIYTYHTGPVLPEAQFAEQFIISREGVEFTRNGMAENSLINSGAWQIPAEEQFIQELFDRLQLIQCKEIKRIEPVDTPDGGYTVSYEMVYVDGSRCGLMYDPGVEYIGGEAVTNPVTNFIATINLPSDAVSRFKE